MDWQEKRLEGEVFTARFIDRALFLFGQLTYLYIDQDAMQEWAG